MAFDTIEASAADGRPVEIYHFNRVGVLHWRYTSADRDIVFDSQTYTAKPIRRNGTEQGPEVRRSNLVLHTSHDLPVIQPWKISPPSDAIQLALRQFHYGDADARVIWQGSIVGVSFSGPEAEITLEPMGGGDLRATGLRRNYQRSCPHDLYGPGCTVDPEAFRVNGTAASIAGLEVSVSAAEAYLDGHFDGGILQWEVTTGVYEKRFITSHVGAVLKVSRPPVGLVASTAVALFPGCDHTLLTCSTKFSNELNYGGMPYIPRKNPFGSSPLF